MKEQPHFNDILTKKFFEEYYIEKKMSFPMISKMLEKNNEKISISTLHKYCKKYNLTRTWSEARRNSYDIYIDYNKTYLTEKVIDSIDGFLLGDGGAGIGKRRKPAKTDRAENNKIGRLSCGVQYEEFCRYLMKDFGDYIVKVQKGETDHMKQGFVWVGCTKFHPDLYKQYIRWYPENSNGQRIKQPPNDVRITPNSVMMWYLGDGCLHTTNNHDVASVHLSTDGFAPERVEFLVNKLLKTGIDCHRNKENRIRVSSKGLPAFFDFIGRKSPIKCYNYKFDLPLWRFESKRLSEVAEELNISYNTLSYLIKIGKVECFRLTEKGRPRLLPKHIQFIKDNIKLLGL